MIFVNLIPSSMWYLNLRKLLDKQKWTDLSNEIRQEQNWTCQFCDISIKQLKQKRFFHCHEMWDFDDKNNIVKLVCLVCLCSYCHEATHFGYASIKGKSKASFWHICKVNKWDKTTTSNYLEACFEKWSQRSNKQWIIDLNSIKDWINENDIKIVKEALIKEKITYME